MFAEEMHQEKWSTQDADEFIWMFASVMNE